MENSGLATMGARVTLPAKGNNATGKDAKLHNSNKLHGKLDPGSVAP